MSTNVDSARVIRIITAVVLGTLVVVPVAIGIFAKLRSSQLSGHAVTVESGSCKECHPGVWNEWEGSMHARAWRDPTVQASFQSFGFDRKCQSCHAPEPRLFENLAEPVVRHTDLKSGVDCLTCHLLPDGRVAARRTIGDAPCKPQQSSLLVSSSFCGACHVSCQDDWSKSPFATQNKDCNECHMPQVAARRGGRSHEFLGGHDDATVRSGARIDCRDERSEVVVRVSNHATGHNFPGERHHRILIVQVIERDLQGEILLAAQEVIKGVTPFLGEASSEKIQSGENVEVRFPVISRPAVAQVTLLYKLYPWYTDQEALSVCVANVELNEP